MFLGDCKFLSKALGFLAFALVSFTHAIVFSGPALHNQLPEEVYGWKKGTAEYFTGKELYRFLDGGAELYLAYSEKVGLEHFTYRKDSETIEVDVFDLQSAANAFGVFSLTREKIEKDFGQGSEYREGLLVFWKDRYYFSLTAYPETLEKKEVIFQLARLLEKIVLRTGQLPGILKLLPVKDQREESVRYLRHPAWLADLCSLGEANPLEIGPGQEMVLAGYNQGHRILVVGYPSLEKAVRAEKNFYRWISTADFSEEPSCRFSGSRRTGRHLVVVLQAADQEKLSDLLKNALKGDRK